MRDSNGRKYFGKYAIRTEGKIDPNLKQIFVDTLIWILLPKNRARWRTVINHGIWSLMEVYKTINATAIVTRLTVIQAVGSWN
jgi:hypothetical protein